MSIIRTVVVILVSFLHYLNFELLFFNFKHPNMIITHLIILESGFTYFTYNINKKKKELLKVLENSTKVEGFKIPFLEGLNLDMFSGLSSNITFTSYLTIIFSDLALFVFINIVITILYLNK
jgi:hypothetical protein